MHYRLSSVQACSLARALDIVGDRWTLLIVRDALLGVTRFDGFLRNLGIARNILTDRLNTLVGTGVLDRTPYQDRPVRHEYHLTDRGRELLPVVLAVTQWGERHLADPADPSRLVEHRECGGSARATVICTDCGRPLAPTEVSSRPSPRPLAARPPEQRPAGPPLRRPANVGRTHAAAR
ncbi:DNA-binding transcriptional regulator, HxlR family [Micromonospora pallida]|uniref:DNA-binding transcriptional regulator, HxlR family n=1 Tax=Micromonospora pallida TaxID=145854 RepID=A0A1C6S2F8_9ACTN|nr:helix-turn-helix domain-containing protein [Micromonospora pallida]SCL23443.1 DNA-binding transcriptional regulator, HxlR family [Micromonospora pallida]